MRDRNRIKLFYRRSTKVVVSGGGKEIIVPFKGISLFMIVVLVIICLFLALRSDFFLIHKIKIDNKDDISCVYEDQILKSLSLLGKSLFFLDSEKQEKILLDQFDCLNKVDVEKKWPDEIVVKIEERQPVLLLQLIKGDEEEKYFNFDLKSTQSADLFLKKLATSSSQFSQNFYILDKSGKIFKKTDRSGNLPVLKVSLTQEPKIGEKILGIEFVLNLIKELAGKGFVIQEVKKVNLSTIDVTLKDGPLVEFSQEKDLNYQVSSLQLILTQAKIENENLKKIDFRFGKPVTQK